jgi:hypothetical protein
MYLTKQQCNSILESLVKECVDLLNEYKNLSAEYNLNDFNPNENKMEKIQKKLEILNTIIEEFQKYNLLID